MELEQYKKQIGEQLRLERRLRELSQREVAEAIGVSDRSVMIGERGEVSLDILYAYAKWLGLDWLKLTCVALEVCDE